MKVFKFKNKQQTDTYTIYTVIAAVLSIFIFFNLNIYINKAVAYLLVTIVSSLSILFSMKKASKEFVEISFQENNIKFNFLNKLKEPISVCKSEISAVILDDSIEFTNVPLGKIIGIAYKFKLEEGSDWDEFLSLAQAVRDL